MKLVLQFFVILLFITIQSSAQKSSFLILGDLHYDLIDDHDMEWLGTKPEDLRQVTKEYTVYTRENWNDFMEMLRQRVHTLSPALKGVIQLGDLSEGLAGSNVKAAQMAFHAMKAIDEVQLPAPWIMAKGNHDVTGPGAREAFQEFYVPMIRKQTGNAQIHNASYSYRCGDVQITCLDPWDSSIDMVAFLKKELAASDAKFKLVAIHEPVIPVTERCWQTLKNNPQQREKLLEVIAKNKAIVLCGHLHRYAVVSRRTSFGPVVQVMVNSLVKDRNLMIPSQLITEFGPSLAENIPLWQPETLDARKAILSEEAKHVFFYKQADLPGYAIIKTDGEKGTVRMEYFAAFAKEPYDSIDLTELLRQ